MKATTVFLAALLLASGAWGQSTSRPILIPPTLSGQGTQTATGSSATISAANVTPTGASGTFPLTALPTGYLTVKVLGSQTAMIAVCWLGGMCTFASGEVIEVGESVTRNVATTFNSSPPTVISQSGNVVFSVEW